MKRLRILVLVLKEFMPPDSLIGLSDKEIDKYKTEYDVLTALEHLGHETHALGVEDEFEPIHEALREKEPNIVFNLLEEFARQSTHVPYVLGYLELMSQAYTGCNPRGFIIADNKPMSKRVLRHHRIPSPDFVLLPRGRAIRRPKRLGFPLIIKSSTEHGSVGISQASVVHDDAKFRERVEFVHEQLGTGAIAEEFIEGRELYVGVLGNERLETLPIWELVFDKMGDGALRIATAKVKWDLAYQERSGIVAQAAKDLSDGAAETIRKLCKRVYRILGLSGYARMDLRLTEEGKVFLLEPNPNPQLARYEEFAESAQAMGLDYNDLIQRIVNLGLRYARDRAQ